MLALPCAVSRCAPGAATAAVSSAALPPPPPLACPLAPCRPRRLGLPRPVSLRGAARQLAPPLSAAGRAAGERAPAQAVPPAEGDPLREADAPVRAALALGHAALPRLRLAAARTSAAAFGGTPHGRARSAVWGTCGLRPGADAAVRGCATSDHRQAQGPGSEGRVVRLVRRAAGERGQGACGAAHAVRRGRRRADALYARRRSRVPTS